MERKEIYVCEHMNWNLFSHDSLLTTALLSIWMTCKPTLATPRLWGFISGLSFLFPWSIFTPVTYCFYYCCLAVSFENRKCQSSSFVHSFSRLLWLSAVTWDSTGIWQWIFLFLPKKEVIGILRVTALNLSMTWGSTDISQYGCHFLVCASMQDLHECLFSLTKRKLQEDFH